MDLPKPCNRLLLRTSLNDKHIREIFPKECELVSWCLQPINITVPTTETANAATVANHIDRQPSSAPLTDNIYHQIVVAKAVTLAPHAHTRALVKMYQFGNEGY